MAGGPSDIPDGGELPERNLLAGRRRDQHGFQRGEVVAQFAAVADVHRVSLQALDGGGDVHAADRGLDHVLHVADGQAVARDRVAVDGEVQIVAAHDALGVDAEGAGDVAHHRLDLLAELLEDVEVGTAELDADRRLDAGGKHVDAGLDRHGPGVGHARDLNSRIHLVRQLVHRHPRPPLALRLQRDGGLDHRKRGRIGRGFGAADLAEDVLHFGECLDDLVGLLEKLPGLGDRDAGQRGRHVEQIALPERRHELRTEPLERDHRHGDAEDREPPAAGT